MQKQRSRAKSKAPAEEPDDMEQPGLADDDSDESGDDHDAGTGLRRQACVLASFTVCSCAVCLFYDRVRQ